MEYKIINESDLQANTDITSSFKDKAFDIILSDAQELDLKPLLGHSLYLDLLQNLDTDKYDDILNPKIWQYNGKSYNHLGLKKVLSLFVATRYNQHSSSQSTVMGYRQLNNDFSIPSPEKEIARLSELTQSAALAYWQDINLYLIHNKTDYPLFDYFETETKSQQPIKSRAIGQSYSSLEKFKNWDR